MNTFFRKKFPSNIFISRPEDMEKNWTSNDMLWKTQELTQALYIYWYIAQMLLCFSSFNFLIGFDLQNDL